MNNKVESLGWGKVVVFSLVPAVLLLLLTELGLRLYVNQKAEQEAGRALPAPAQRNQYQREDPLLGYSLRPGYDSGGIRVNSLGFRGPEISKEKPAGVLRVFALGDSTTFGLAGKGCPYPAQLGRILERELPDFRIEVVNAGVEGYSTAYGLRLLRHRIAPLEPDVVLIYIGWNDLYGTNPFVPNDVPMHEKILLGKNGSTGNSLSVQIARMLDHLYLAQFLRRVIYLEIPRILGKTPRGRSSDAEREVHPRALDLYKARLEQLVDATRSAGADPVLMTLPTVLSETMSDRDLSIVHYPTWAKSDPRLFLKVVRKANETIREVAREKAVPLVDNARLFDSLPEKGKYFFDTLHMYCEGYGILARNVAEELIRQGLLARAK